MKHTEIEASLHKIRSVNEAVFKMGQLTSISGPHRAGKTSIAKVLGTTMLCKTDAFGTTANNCEGIKAKGARVAGAMVRNGDRWSVKVRWPDNEVIVDGDVPEANEVTVGNVSPAAMSPAEWAKFVRQVSNAGDVKENDICDAMTKCGLDGDTVLKVAHSLKGIGWDGAAKGAEKAARQDRANWEALTGENFGSSKADGWTHPKYAEIDEEGLTKEIELLQNRIQRAEVQGEALGGSKEDLEKEIDSYVADLNTKSSIKAQLESEVKELEGELSKYPTSKVYICPCCQGELHLSGDDLIIADRAFKSVNTSSYDKLVKSVGDKGEHLAKTNNAMGTLRAKLEAAQAMLKRVGKPDINPEHLRAFKAELANKQEILEGYTRTHKAEELFKSWKVWSAVAKLLGPAGMRLDATKKALKEIQPEIDDISRKLFDGNRVLLYPDEKGVHLHFEDLEGVTWPYASLVWKGDPNSAALRIQVLFQILEYERLAKLGAVMPILVDRFDLLLKAERNEMLRVFLERGVQAVVFQAQQVKPEKDLLKKAGFGSSYFINDGRLEAV